MNTDDRENLNQLTSKVIGAAQRVSSALGCGFLEKVYENALVVELRGEGADLLVEGRIIVELRAVRALDNIHEAQCINYLRASGLPICLLMNFARPRLDVRRMINA